MRRRSAREQQEFQRLVERFYRPVARFFANRGCPEIEVEDLTQETFLKICNGLNGFRGEASEDTWLFKIAANTWINALRRRSAGKRSGLETSLDDLENVGLEPTVGHGPASPSEPLERALAEERVRLVREAIDDLPPQMRRVVFLRVAQDMKYREIAAVMQISIQTVKSQLHAARDQLRERLGEYYDESK